MPTFVLDDHSRDIWVESFSVDANELGVAPDHAWSVKKTRLKGGRRDGVDLILVDNGAFRFSIVPTRGMGIWKGWYEGLRVGWDSPVTDGPINPMFVNLAAAGGLGWLDGFDELLARCGLENNGAPYEVKTKHPDGNENNTVFGLHGKIANLPASFVAVHVDEHAPHALVVEGHVEETRLFGSGIRMATRITTVPGSNALTVRDEFINLKDQPVEMQVLYHWNFGPPFLAEGSRFVAPARVVTPRDARAVEGLANHTVYGPPEPGYAEQVYFHELLGRSATDKQTVALLRNAAADKGVALRFTVDQLPAFTLWKNTGGLRDGYVTGLEPGTNFPNARPFEKARGRVVTLPPDARYVAETTLEVLASAEAVLRVEHEIERIQSQATAKINPRPTEPHAPEG
jgi:hypothetical protein